MRVMRVEDCHAGASPEKQKRPLVQWFDAVVFLLFFMRRRVATPTGWFSYWLPTPFAVCVMSTGDLVGGASPVAVALSFIVSIALVAGGYVFLTRTGGKERGRSRYYALTALMGTIGIFGMAGPMTFFGIASGLWLMAAYLYYAINLDRDQAE